MMREGKRHRMIEIFLKQVCMPLEVSIEMKLLSLIMLTID